MPRQTRRPGRDPRGKRWFPAREIPFDGAPLRTGGILVGPVTIVAAAIAASALIIVPLAPQVQAGLLVSPIQQQVDDAKPSRILRVTPADLQPPALDRPLYGRIQPIETPPPSRMATPGSLVEQGLANLLYQRALAGIVQPDVVVPSSNIVRVPFAELTPPIWHSLAGVFQDVAIVDPSHIVRVPIADIVITSNVQYPLAGVAQQADELRYSILVGGQLPVTPIPLRVIAGAPQDVVDRDLPRIIRIPFADFVPSINILFQRPLGVIQDVTSDVVPRIIRVPVADVAPPPFNLFLQPLAGRDQFDQPRSSMSLLVDARLPIVVPVPFELFQRPLTSITRPSFDDSQLEDISVILFGLEPERDVLFLRPLAGREQPPTVVGVPRVIRIMPADIPPPPIDVLFQHPLLGKDQPPPIVGVPFVITVTPPTPHLDPLFQYPRVAIIQIPLVTLPSKMVIVIPPDPIPPPSTGKQQRRRWHRSGG